MLRPKNRMDINCHTILDGLCFPEGPIFDREGNLWFVEIHGGNLSRWNGRSLDRFNVTGTPNGAAIDDQGMVWFCDSGRGEIRQFDPKIEAFTTVCFQTADGERLKRPNDLIFDSAGNLLFSDHADGRESPVSTICVLPEGSERPIIISSNKRFTNGLALIDDERILIFSETYNQQLWAGEWDTAELKLKNEHPFAKAGDGPWGPDGITTDSEENLYVAIFNESRINIYNKKGELMDWINTPGRRPTSCVFDPSGTLGLIVTEADRGELLSFPQLGGRGRFRR